MSVAIDGFHSIGGQDSRSDNRETISLNKSADGPSDHNDLDEKVSRSSRSSDDELSEPKYRLDFFFDRLHQCLDFVQDGAELLLDATLRVLMSKPVQMTAGILTGVLFLLVAQQLSLLLVGVLFGEQ